MTVTDDVSILLKPIDRDGIPFDVFSSLSQAITTLYPNARMGPGEYGRGMTLLIGPEDRGNTIRGKKRAIKAAKVEHDPDEPDIGVIGFDGETLSHSTPEEATQALLHYGLAILLGTEGASNCVEQRAHTKDGRAVELVVKWGHGKSPMQLRDEALRERDEAVQERVDLLNAIDAHIGHDGDRLAGCLVCEHMGPKE